VSTRRIDIELEMDVPQSFKVARCRVEEGISTLTHAAVEIVARDELDLRRALAGDAKVRLSLDGVLSRLWTLKVGKVSFRGAKQGSLRYLVDLHAHPWLLRATQDTRKFRNTSHEDIISKVLGQHSVPFRWKLTRPTAERNYVVQYHESNLDFVRRLLEFEGIYFTVDEAGVLVLGDRSSAEPEIDGEHHVELINVAGAMDRDRLGVHDFTRGAEIAPGMVTVSDHDWKKPKVALLTSTSADADQDLEIYDYPSGYRTPAEGALLARMRLEALRAQADFVEGRGNVVSFAPARVFLLGGAVGAEFGGEYLLTRVEHEIIVPGYEVEPDAQATTYENSFRAIPRDVPFRPPVVTPRPTVAGNHTIMVRGPAGEEIHTDDHGRFKAQFHWDREATGTDEDSRWVRMTQESATSMTLARVGWEVTAGYIDGDPSRPVGLARQINGVMPPTYGQPAKKNVMTIKTPTYPGGGGYNEWRMDDSAGAMAMDVRAQRELLYKTQNDKTETIGNNETHISESSFTHGVTRDQKVSIGGNSDKRTESSQHLLVGNDRTLSVGGSENITVKGVHESRIEGDDLEKVGATRKTVAEGDGSIDRQANKDMKRMVTGSYMELAAGNIDVFSGKDYLEKSGGAKVTLTSKGSLGQTVDGPHTLTVTGTMLRKSEKDISYSAKFTTVNIGTTCSFKSDERIEVKSKLITIEGQSEVSFAADSGKILLKLTPTGVELKGKITFKAGDRIIVTGAKDILT